MEKTVALILAAGEGKRMKSDKPKVLQEVLFKPMIDWVVDAAQNSDIDDICIVVGKTGGRIVSHLEARGIKIAAAIQEKPLGTGHAVMQAADYIKNSGAEDVLILCGDAPFIGSGIIKSSYFEHKNSENDVTVMSALADNPTGYGRIVRDKGYVVGIVEEKDTTPEQKMITEINAGAYWFRAGALLEALTQINDENAQHEYYLTDTVGIIGKNGLKGGSCLLGLKFIAGANDQKQLMELNGIARKMVFEKLFDSGVSIIDESGIIIGPNVTIGSDTVILPGTIIKGETRIGNGCTIGPNSMIFDCEIGNNVVFNASQAQKSRFEAGVTVGPFSNIRSGCVLHENVHVGDFVEVKNSEIGKGTKAGHLTYVGDSDVGSGVNFGCGVVTVNYDGVKKSRTTIGDNAFIGCNTNLVAPVKVGDGAYTAAGATVTRDVPEGALAVARSRQENIEGWVARRRPKK